MRTKILSLEELSFEVLLKNFRRYVSAFLYIEIATDLKKNLEVLQILYSRRILTELEKRPKLKECDLEFLLNRYLKCINIDTLLDKFNDKDFIIKKLISIGDSLSTIICSEYCDPFQGYTSVLEAVLPHAVNAMKISIPGKCTDELLKTISLCCRKLEALSIERSPVTNEGIKTFLENSKSPLKFLNITGIVLSYNSVQILLRDIPTLQELKFPDLPHILYRIDLLYPSYSTQEDIAKGKKYNLSSLDFSTFHHYPVLKNMLVICNILCPFIKKLVVYISNLEELNACAMYSELESLEIDGEIDLSNFLCSRGKQLKNLTAKNCKLSMSSLIQSCPHLETLILNNVQYLESDKSNSNIKDLKACSMYSQLNSCEINGEIDLNNFLLTRGKQLKNLTLKNCKLSMSTLIESCPLLETLQLSNVQYLKSDKKCTQTLGNIKSLKLDMKLITEANVLNYINLLLSSCLNLESLYLYNFLCTSENEHINSILLSISNNLRHLNFMYSCVDENFLSEISTIFKSNNVFLESLSFEACENVADEDDVNYYFPNVVKIFDGEQYEVEYELSELDMTSESDMEILDSDYADYQDFEDLNFFLAYF